MNQATLSPFISYPRQAAFGRVLPKNKIYEHSGATPAVREMFVRQVEQIVWQYKLAPETINLASKPGVPELQIFAIQLKTPALKHEVLRCIDGAIQFPIIFELTFEGKSQVVAAFKRPSESDSNRWVVSDYFSTQWMPTDGAGKRVLIRNEYFENQNGPGKPYRSTKSLYDIDCAGKKWRVLATDLYQNNGLRGDDAHSDSPDAAWIAPADGSDDAYLMGMICK